ncbi:Proteasome inhibitor PI31 subunit [Gryllus bimaculatus]|nr:Proteasome inhibitor PI31 subunit [Gryllus bimaculatus]
MASCMFGWDLIYKLAEKDINKKEDVLLLLVHWYLVKSGLKCVGLGDDKTVPESDEGSETLPEGWSDNAVYALRYVHNSSLFILHGTTSEDDIIFNLMRASDMVVSNVTFNVEETVKALTGPIETIIPTHCAALDSIKKDLIDPVFHGKQRAASTQTAEDPLAGPDVLPRSFPDDPDPLRIGAPRRAEPSGSRWDPLRDPLSVGRSDLNPFAPGGGMIFDPFSGRGNLRDPDVSGIPGGLPRGSVPPGARFDPVGPPIGRGRAFPPDHDHLPPPGYDDMFM